MKCYTIKCITFHAEIFVDNISQTINLTNGFEKNFYHESHWHSQCFIFQITLFFEIRTLVTWLKSTLLLKIKCFDTAIYMKTQYLQTNKMQHYLGKENVWKAGGVRDRVGIN